MAKQEKYLVFTFENPNTTAAFAEGFRRVMLDKLAVQGTQDGIIAV